MSGTWSAAARPAPLNVGTVLLLTDGSVMAQDDFTADWWRLTPDAAGDYANGSWFQLASAKHRRLHFASAVLADGRVFVGGGKYSADANTPSDLLACEIYDPETNMWADLPPPPGWSKMGDAPCCVLPNGTVLVGNIEDGQCAIFDPKQTAWRPTGTKFYASAAGETWTLLPDGSVLTADCKASPRSERYFEGAWHEDDSVPGLVETVSGEIGPAVLLPDGKVFAIGATGNTGIFSPPPAIAQRGSWAAGPPILPQTVGGKTMAAKDAPACLLPNGKVLFVAGAVSGAIDDYGDDGVLFEYDGTAITALPSPAGTVPVSPLRCRLLILPTGQAMLTTSSRIVRFYMPDGPPLATCVPAITQAPVPVSAGGTYVLRGRLLNGVSQACSFGDDASNATNYPLVRLWSRSVPPCPTYCRTYGHSTMGVATGNKEQSTNFRVPAGMAEGFYDLELVVNGVPSAKQEVIVKGAVARKTVAEKSYVSGRDPEDDYQLQEEMFWRDLNEVHLLMDFISGRADTSLTNLKDVPNPDVGKPNAAATLTPQEVLQRVCLIRFPPVGTPEQKARDASLLLLVKDKLNAMAYPARGLSVAFTAMFAGTAGATPAAAGEGGMPRFGADGPGAAMVDYLWGAPTAPPPPTDKKPRRHVTGFAIASYPNLEAQARKFRRVFGVLPFVALFWLVLTALTSWDLSTSSQTLRTRLGDLAIARQANATDDTCQIGVIGGKKTIAAGGGTQPSTTSCAALLRAETPGFYANDDDRRGLFIDHRIWHPIGFAVWWYGPVPPKAPPANAPAKPPQAAGAPDAACDPGPDCSYEIAVAGFGNVVVAVFTDYVLPMMFGVLGTLAGLMRMISSKVRESTLGPRDYRLVYSLVPLGAVAGLAVGLVVTPSTVGSGNSALTLSAAGLAFLAGYGADSFFAMIDALLTRVFSTAPQQASGSK